MATLSMVLEGAASALTQPTAAASTVSVACTVVADTYVSQSAPDKTYGSQGSLSVAAARGRIKRTLLRFSCPAFYRYASDVSATLSLNPSASQAKTVYEVRPQPDSSWTEAATMWRNQPALSPTVLATRTGLTNNAYNDFVVGADGISWQGGTVSYEVVSNASKVSQFHSRESSSGLKAKLTVSYTDPGLTSPMRGLISRFTTVPAGWEDVENGITANVNWADIQSTYGGPIIYNADPLANCHAGSAAPDCNALDQALAMANDYNLAHPGAPQWRVNLRFLAGTGAPAFAKQLGGDAVTVANGDAGKTGIIGRFWRDDFGAAYADVQRRLAAVYDGNPLIGQVFTARCMLFFAEPLIRMPDALLADGTTNKTQLWNAGYRPGTWTGQEPNSDAKCLRDQIDAMDPWGHTHVALSFNPYQQITSATTWSLDEPTTETIMDYGRARLGARFLTQNNSIRCYAGMCGAGIAYDSMYAKMAALGPASGYQTSTAAKLVGTICETIQGAIDRGGNDVELPLGFHNLANCGDGADLHASLAVMDASLEANPTE